MSHSGQFLIFVICLFINGVSLSGIPGVTPLPPVVFSPANYIFLVAEESGNGTVIGRVNILTNENLTLTFSTNDAMFGIDSNSRDISLLSSAPDFETTSSEPTQFQVTVSYSFKSVAFSLTSNITIYYTDINDNSPFFSLPSYTFNFTLDLPPGSLLGFILATDSDSNPFNFISYSVESNYSSSISVTEEGGIYTSVTFLNGTYSFMVTATDSGIPPRNTSVTVYLNVEIPRTPEDAVSPVLQQTKYFFQIAEDIGGQSTIGFVAANKDSSAINSTFLYSSNPGELIFQFEVSTGALTNQQSPFDFESGVTNYSLDVIAKLSFAGSSAIVKQDSSPVTVFLRNLNEHSPVVAMDPYRISISSDVTLGSAVGKLPTVTDLDLQNDFSFANNTNSPFSIDRAGFIYLSSQLDQSVSSYQLPYTVSDTEMLGLSRSTSATLIVDITPPSVPPVKSFPTRDVEISHSCDGPNSHTFSFTWLPPTDNSNPTHYGVTVSCFLSPLNQSVTSLNVTQPLAVITVSVQFDRFTYCNYEVKPYPLGPSVNDQLVDFSFVTSASTNFSIQATNENILIVRVTNILMCLSDLYNNIPLFGSRLTVNDTNGLVTEYDASYANYYDAQNATLTVVGYSSVSSSLVEDMVYSVSVNFPVHVFPLIYSMYNHTSVSVARITEDLGWTQTCTPAFYTYTLSNTSVIDQSCSSSSLLFLRATTPNSYYQSLLPVSIPVDITVRDTMYGLTEWDSDQLITISLLQLFCQEESVSHLYWNQVVQYLFLMHLGYSLSDTAIPTSLSLTVDPISFCSLDLTPNSTSSELTAAFQAGFTVTTDVFNETSATSHLCEVTTTSLEQLIILAHTPNSQVAPAVEFTRMVANDITLLCDWLLTPGGIYNGRSVIVPLSTHKLSEVVTIRNFTFQIAPVDDNSIPLPLLVDYGASSGDTVLGKGQDVTSSQISLPSYFLIGSSYLNTAYVSNKGLISFGNPFPSPYPEIFPGYSDLSKNAYIIAPFWSNIDTTFLGQVSWQLYTSNATLLNTLSSLAKTHAKAESGFVAQTALVATWHKVRPYPAHGMVYYRCLLIGQDYMPSCTQHNTFQAVVLSDGGNNTHVLFSYNCRDFDWFKAPFNAAIGFNTGATFYYDNHHLSTTDDVRMAVCANTDSTTVIGYRISSTPGVVPTQTSAEKCRDRITADRVISTIPAGDVLPPDFITRSCPSDLLSAQIDSRFFLHSNSPSCYTPVFPASDDQSILCCYATDSNTFIPHFSTFLRYSPVAKTQYGMYEEGLFGICCGSTISCSDYYAIRPRVSVEGFNRTGFAGGFGDPHFITFDGTQFTFNAIGEFVLTKSESLFEAQIRTSKLDTISATYTSAIVLKSDTSDLVQVEISGANLKVLTTGRIEVTNVPIYPQFWTGNGYKLSYQSTNQIIVVFASGVTAKVWHNSGALFYAISLPNTFSDTLLGLLGNWNGNASDDFTHKGGMILNLELLPPLQRDIAIHTFGLSWSVGGGSLFQYSSGTNTATFTDTSFVPIYPSQLTPLLNATTLCGSSLSCVYDFVVSSDTILATNTLTSQNQLTQFRLVSSGTPPNLLLKNGTGTVRVVPGVWFYFLFEVFDPNSGFTVGVTSSLSDVSIGLSNNLTDFRKFYVLKFRVLAPNEVFGVTVWARGREGLSSGFSFVVNVCDCEFGVCSSSSFTQESYALLYGKLTCVCNPGYTGTTCSEDLNACTTHYCYPEVSCVDQSPPSLTAECATCPSGTKGDGRDCEDYNECSGDRGFLHNCSATEECSNVVGGFECTCIAGYERNTEGYCVDTDECIHPLCHQTCTNTPGSYHCSCVAGMFLSADATTCQPQVLCVASNCDTNTQVCARIGANDLCFCLKGFSPNEVDSFSCLDLDECQSGICQHLCTNQIGGYSCSCQNGYKLATNGRACEDINECVSADLCPDTYVCSNFLGGHTCINPLNPFPVNGSIPRFSLDVPAIVAGSTFAFFLSISILILIIYICYKDAWRSWRRRGRKGDTTESAGESGTQFNIFHE